MIAYCVKCGEDTGIRVKDYKEECVCYNCWYEIKQPDNEDD